VITEENTAPPSAGAPIPARPTVLTVLCILTFIGSGMNLFSSLFISAFYETFTEVAKDVGERFNLPGMEILLEMSPAYFLTTGIFYAGSLAGAILMMLMRKAGFHVYTISQILLLLAPMYFLGLKTPGVPELLFTGLFILLYSRHLKLMR